MSGDNETKEAPNRGGMSPTFQHWVAQALGVVDSELTIHAIAGDASPRRYFRVTRNPGSSTALAYRPEGASDELIAVDAVIAAASPPSENNSAFLAVQLLLEQSGLSVPRQFANDLEQGFFLMEDFGDKLLSSVLSPQTARTHLPHVLEQLIKLAMIPVTDLNLPQFDTARISEELHVFPEWFAMRHLGLSREELPERILQNLSLHLAERFLQQPQCFVHRDFHSRNMMCLDDGSMGLIDFQDAVVGPLTYDVVSVLKDCYIDWPREDQLYWLETYHARLRECGLADGDLERFIRDFDLVGLQRHLRVLGVFARLWLRDEKPGYLRDLPLVLAYTREVLALYSGESIIAEFTDWFESVLMPRVEQQDWYRGTRS